MAKKRVRSRRRSVVRRRARLRGGSAEVPAVPAAGAVDIGPLSAAVRAVAKSFAVIALRLAEGKLTASGSGRAANVGPRARFLNALGLEPAEIAAILGSTEPSVRELLSRARRG